MVGKTVRTAFFILAACSGILTAQSGGEWAFDLNASGMLGSAELKNPKTQLGIESSITISLSPTGEPTHGIVRFHNGVKRDLTSGEVPYYWNEFNGNHALWAFYASLGKTMNFNPDSAVVPTTMYGKISRMVDKRGKEYYGRLFSSESSNPDWFVIEINGNRINVYRRAIAVIQQLK